MAGNGGGGGRGGGRGGGEEGGGGGSGDFDTSIGVETTLLSWGGTEREKKN